MKRFALMTFPLLLIACNRPEDENPKTIKPLDEYTAANPREWKEFADSHEPQLKWRGETLVVETDVFNSPAHHIEKIGIFDARKTDVMVHSFDATRKDLATASFRLAGVKKKDGWKVFVKCNLHDLWTKVIE